MGLLNKGGRDASRWEIFPATRTLASYDSFTQHIELNEVTQLELREALRNPGGNPQNAIRVLPLLYHEFRHWIDHISTLWGMRRLVATYNAMHAKLSDEETGLWRIMEYRRLVDRDHMADYYSTKEVEQPPPGMPRRWIYSHTCGRRYDRDGRVDPECPIVFTRYAWPDGSTACRVPFSVSSLLETGSMAFEIGMEGSILVGFPHDERVIEARNIVDRRIPELYDVDLGIYSTAVHLVANRMRLSNTEDAYALAGPLASLCLNVPDELFDGLRIPEDFEPWGDNNGAAIRQRDRGYLYMLLCFHARKDLVGQPTRWVENAARRAGLPPLFDIQGRTATAMREALDGAIDGPYRERLEQIAQLGIRIKQELGVAITLLGTLDSMRTVLMPPIVCGDLEVEGLTPENAVHFNEWCSECSRLQSQMTEFVAACGY